MSNSVELPTYLIHEFGAIERLPESELSAWLKDRKLAVISGYGETRKICEKLIRELKKITTDVKMFTCSDHSIGTIEELVRLVEQDCPEMIIGVGGGTVLDVTKVVATRSNAPMMLVPTAVSSDAICSPIASIRMDPSKNVSIEVNMPKAVLIDREIVASCPPRFILAGMGDLLSNKTALFDWQLAHQTKNDKLNPFAYLVANNAVDIFLHTVTHHYTSLDSLLPVATESLILSGMAMAIAGNSRPCSGSEHLISHALDNFCGKKALHGEQVAIGSLISEFLQERKSPEKSLRHYFIRLGLPTHYKELGYTKEEMRFAIQKAPTIRNRYTILDEYQLTDRQVDDLLDEVFS